MEWGWREWHDSGSVVKIVNGIQHSRVKTDRAGNKAVSKFIQQKETEVKGYCSNKMPLSLAKFLDLFQFSTQSPSVKRKAGSPEKRTLQDHEKHYCNSPSPSPDGSTIIYLGDHVLGKGKHFF